jgi:hypothetical protein
VKNRKNKKKTKKRNKNQKKQKEVKTRQGINHTPALKKREKITMNVKEKMWSFLHT